MSLVVGHGWRGTWVESWLERDHVVALDFDTTVVGVDSQLFWLSWTTRGRVRSHTPDYFARRTGGSAVVVGPGRPVPSTCG
jgi:hypothetical protein